MLKNMPIAKVHVYVREEINSRGLKIRAVAHKAGIREDVFYSLVQGKRKFNEDELLAVCVALERPPSYFLRMERWKEESA